MSDEKMSANEALADLAETIKWLQDEYGGEETRLHAIHKTLTAALADLKAEREAERADAVELLECCGEPAEGGICWCQYRREHGAEELDR